MAARANILQLPHTRNEGDLSSEFEALMLNRASTRSTTALPIDATFAIKSRRQPFRRPSTISGAIAAWLTMATIETPPITFPISVGSKNTRK